MGVRQSHALAQKYPKAGHSLAGLCVIQRKQSVDGHQGA